MGIIKEVANAHIKIVKERLGHIYTLKPTFEYINNNSEQVARIFVDYVSLFDRFFKLKENEVDILKNVDEIIGDNHHKSAVQFRTAARGNEKKILELVQTVSDPGTKQYKEGMNQLTTMMTNAWDMKVDGLSPKDGDPRSDNVIWGYVQGSNYPEIDVHFVAAHLTERVLTAALKNTSLHNLTKDKDWSFPVSTAIVGLDGVREIGAGGRLFPIWREPRPNGLGWISENRITAFKNSF